MICRKWTPKKPTDILRKKEIRTLDSRETIFPGRTTYSNKFTSNPSLLRNRKSANAAIIKSFKFDELKQ